MEGYKSVEVAFFKKGKFIYIGKPKTPKIVKCFCFGKDSLEKQALIGRGLEYASVTMFVLSVVYLIHM
jgi:hypothetical protein